MEISRKTDYAIRMLSELVRRDGEIVSVRSAAEANDVPYSFARSIQHELVKTGLVESVRGSHGGMRLAVDPRTTTLLQVVESIQGPVFVERSERGSLESDRLATNHAGRCFDPLWKGARRLMRDYLDAVTLYQVVSEGRAPVLVHGQEFAALNAEERAALGL